MITFEIHRTSSYRDKETPPFEGAYRKYDKTDKRWEKEGGWPYWAIDLDSWEELPKLLEKINMEVVISKASLSPEVWCIEIYNGYRE